jgi:predicted TIM-barrel fold metal-dependent hydrolase
MQPFVVILRRCMAPYIVGLVLANAAGARVSLPIFDAHLHYNIEAWEYMPPDKVFALLKANNVLGILSNSRPNEGTWKLLAHQQQDTRIVPFVRVYRDRGDYGTWFQKPEVYAHIVEQLDREPRARGVGEFHLSGDQARHPGVEKLVALARERSLWLHAHVDEVGLRAMLSKHPEAKIIWAHTGFTTPISDVTDILRKHPNVIGELSYRWDVTNGSTLNAAWKAVFTQFADRFVIGSDTWVNQRWESYSDTMGHYRTWLAQLPAEASKKIAYENGERLFGIKLGR